jgi:amino acid transporter
MSDAALELMFFFAEVSAVGIAVCAVGIIDELFSAKEELAGHGTRLHRHCFVPNGGALMTIFSFGMISLSIVVFSIAIILYDQENLQDPVLAFTQNVLEILSIVFLAVGICLAIVDRMRRKTRTRGHNFATARPPNSSNWQRFKNLFR